MGPGGAVALKKMGEFFSRPSVIIVIIVIAVLAYIYFKGKSDGKKKAAKDLKDGLKTDVDGSLLTQEDGTTWTPKTVAERLHKDIYSWLAPRDVDVYKVLISMNDERIKAVHNYWMEHYFDEDNETLKAAINGENSTIADWADIKKSVLAKFTNLGLQ